MNIWNPAERMIFHSWPAAHDRVIGATDTPKTLTVDSHIRPYCRAANPRKKAIFDNPAVRRTTDPVTIGIRRGK
jgi:hypothetical protein